MIASTINFTYPVLAEIALTNETAIFSALLISTLVILLTSQLLGEMCAWLKLPPVLGQLVGGISLGVSVLKILVLAEGRRSRTGLCRHWLFHRHFIRWVNRCDRADGGRDNASRSAAAAFNTTR